MTSGVPWTLMLGQLFFVIYVNDLEEDVGDSKMLRTVKKVV